MAKKKIEKVREIVNYDKNGNIVTQKLTGETGGYTRETTPALVKAAQDETIKTVEPTVKTDVKTALNNSAVKKYGFNLSNAITDLANLNEALENEKEAIPVVGKLFKAKNIAKKSITNAMTNMGEGALKTGEGVLDTLNDWADAINNPLTYTGNKAVYGKEKADKALKENQKKQEEFIKRNLVQDFQDKTGYSDIRNDLEKDSLVKQDNFGGQIAQGIGGMVPALLAGQYLGFTPEMTSTKGLSGLTKAKAVAGNLAKSYASQLPSNTILGASSYGSGLEEALNEGATREQARKYGLANTAIEQGTEYLTGGIPGLGGKGGLDDVVEPLIDKNSRGYANALLKAGYGAFGEGLEEYTGAMLDPLAKKIYSDKPIDWKETNKQALQAGLVGAATGAILNSPSSIQDVQNAKNEIRNQQAQRVQETPVQPSITQNNINTQEQIETTPTRQENEQINTQQTQTRVEPQTVETKPVAKLTQQEQQELDTLKDLPFELDEQQERRMDELLLKQNKDLEKNMSPVRDLSDVRDFNEVGSKKVNAYQYDNPEVKPYFQEVAKDMLYDLGNSTKGERYMTEDGQFKGVKRNVPNDIAELLDGENGVKYSYKEIEDGLNAIIKDNGAENKAVAKRLEFYIDQRLRNGYMDSIAGKIPANNEYIETLRNKNAGENPNIPAEMEKEEVLKFSPEQERQYYKNNGMSDETAKILTEMPKPEKTPIGERIKEGKAKISEQLGYFKRNLVDKGETIYKLGKKTKNPNLYAKYDKRGTTTGEANYDIGVGQTNLEGKRFENFTDKNGNKTSMSLNQIWEGIDPQIGNEYLAHYLNVDRYNQLNEDGTGKYVFGESITDKDSLNRIKELEKEHPELKRFGENVWQYGKNQLQTRVDAGQISQAQADQFLKDTPHYVRLQRNVDTKTSPLLEFDKNGNVKVNKNLKEFKGSTLDIFPFKESMAQYTLDVRNSIRDNIFAQELAKTLGIDANGQSVDNIDDIIGQNPELLKDNGDGTYSLTFFNKGVATTIPVNEGIYESLQPNKHYKFEDTLPFKGIRKFDNFRKGLLTDKNPLFLATNMMKDAFDAPLNSKYPISFAKNYPRAIKEILTNGKYYQQYQALGGLQNTYFDNQEFQKQGSKANPLTWIEKGNNAVEQFPRLAEFISTMEKTGDIDQAMYNAAEITTNFKRGGDWTKAANRNGVTFLNASVQGFSKQIRNFTDIQNPRQAAQLLGKLVVLGIAPGLINDAMWDDDDEYKELQDYQKDNYYLFKGKDGKWIRIPKGRAISVFQSAARRTKYALKGDEKAFDGFVDFAKNQVAPNSPFENNIFAPLSQVSNNKSWSGNKIISDSLSKRPTEEQYNEKTDEISKWIGKQVKDAPIPENFKSPLAINYLIDQYSGVIGDVGLPMITPRSSSDTDNPIKAAAKDKFIFDAANSSKSVGNFYDKKDEIEKQKNSIKATPIDKVKNSYMTSRSMELSELYKKQKDIQNSNLSKEEKYNQSKEIQKQINKFAKETVENVDNIEKEEYYIKIGDTYYKRVIKNGEETYVKDTSKKRPTEEYALYDYFRDKYYKSKESD
jgi:hypothetical protein